MPQLCGKSRRKARIWVALLCAVVILAALPLRAKAADERAPKRPNLTVVISVDMLSQDLMDRYGRDLPGGLGRLQREGVVFSDTFHEHAFTETGPGHSVLLSGRHPASTGITENQWVDPKTEKRVYCVDDPSATNFGEPSGKIGSSDRWFKGTTFGTWLRDQVPGSRVFSISGKDRAAILMAGPKADGVYWFQDGFGFTTSTAYAAKMPEWMTQFNENLLAEIRTRTINWTPIGPMDGLVYPGRWLIGNATVVSELPKLIQVPGMPMPVKGGFLIHETMEGSFWLRWRGSPFFDDATFDAAETLIKQEHLGDSNHTDLLTIGLSATNVIEHAYGNQGPEILDQIRRIDRRLGVFLDRISAGGVSVALVFTGDHGGLDFPERLQDQGIPAIRLDTVSWMNELQSRLRKEFHLDQDLISHAYDIYHPQQVYFKLDVAKQLGDRKDWVPKVEEIIRSMPQVADVASFEELEALPSQKFNDPRDESLRYRLKLSAAPGRSGDVFIVFKPLVSLGGPPNGDPAQHGTPYDYDRRVPLIFWGPWKAERRTSPVSTVDIAPTLAKEFGVKPSEPLDGVVLPLERVGQNNKGPIS
jgi:predicted AlkP superfamily pyrophosphatase or phosphodiesterase